MAERAGIVKAQRAKLLMKGDVRPPVAPPPRQHLSLAAQQRRARREALKWLEYEKEFPHERPSSVPVERVGSHGPEVPGRLPSLGKRRP